MKGVLLLLLLFPIIFCQQQPKKDCFIPGECLRSMTVGQGLTSNREECHDNCQLDVDCMFFTHYGNDNLCLLFGNCVEFSNSSCSDCFSGERDCTEFRCFSKGRCQGTFLSTTHSESPNECLSKCQNNPECNWFTFDDYNYLCTLTSSCESVDTCDSCKYGQLNCQSQPEATKLLAITGHGDGASELLDLDTIDSTCRAPADYPLNVESSVGLTYNDEVMICGGYDIEITNECHKYIIALDMWERTVPMLEVRTKATAIKLRYNEYWIMGGGEYNWPMASTEIFKDGVFIRGPALPEPMLDHCATKINSTHAFLASGRTMDMVTNITFWSGHTYLIDLSSFQWTILPSLTQPRHGQACGFFKTASGAKEIVVAGGYFNGTYLDNVDILSLETLEWRVGPRFPSTIYTMGTAQFDDHFVTTGGYNGNSNIDELYEFGMEEQWVAKGRTLQYPNSRHLVFKVEDELASCLVAKDDGNK